MTVTVRPSDSRDRPFIAELFESYLASERLRSPYLALPSDFASKYLPKLALDAETKGGAILIAESNGERAGFVAVLPQDRPSPWDESSGKSCLIMELHVHPTFRRRGIGRMLLREVETRFTQLGFDWISLGLFASNSSARQFYDRAGFQDSYVFMGKRLGKEPRLP